MRDEDEYALQRRFDYGYMMRRYPIHKGNGLYEGMIIDEHKHTHENRKDR